MSDGRHEVTIRGTPAEVWAFFWDGDALARVLPGCEAIRADGPGLYAATIAIPAQFFTVRADAVIEVQDPHPPRSAVITIDGTPRGFGGAFHVRIPVRLGSVEDADGLVTRVHYGVDVRVEGALASMGPTVLRDAMVGRVKDLAANIEGEIRAGRDVGTAAP